MRKCELKLNFYYFEDSEYRSLNQLPCREKLTLSVDPEISMGGVKECISTLRDIPVKNIILACPNQEYDEMPCDYEEYDDALLEDRTILKECINVSVENILLLVFISCAHPYHLEPKKVPKRVTQKG